MSNTHQLQILLPGTKNGLCKPHVAFTGDPKTDKALVAAYISGVPLKLDGDMTVNIADGATDDVIGFLVYDAAGTGPWDGMGGADQSGQVTFVYGLATVEFPTRVLKGTDAFTPGSKVYAGMGADKGLITTTPSTTGQVLGVVLSNANKANDQLVVQLSI